MIEGNCVALRAEAQGGLCGRQRASRTVFRRQDHTVRREQHRLLAPGHCRRRLRTRRAHRRASRARSLPLETEGSILFVGTSEKEGEGKSARRAPSFDQRKLGQSGRCLYQLDGPGVERIRMRRSARALSCAAARRGRSFVGRLRRGQSRVMRWGAPSVGWPRTHAPVEPRTTLTSGAIEGGAGINVIPREALMSVDCARHRPKSFNALMRFSDVRRARPRTTRTRTARGRPAA